jgi:hypothetical protein
MRVKIAEKLGTKEKNPGKHLRNRQRTGWTLCRIYFEKKSKQQIK